MGYGLKYTFYMRHESGVLHCCYGKKVVLNLDGLGTERSVVAKAGKILQ